MIKKNKLFLSISLALKLYKQVRALKDLQLGRHVPDYGLVNINEWPTCGHGDVINIIDNGTGNNWILRYTISEGVPKGKPVTVRELSLREEDAKQQIVNHWSYIQTNGMQAVEIDSDPNRFILVRNQFTIDDFQWPRVPAHVVKLIRKTQLINLFL